MLFESLVHQVGDFHRKFGISTNPLDDAQQADLRIKRVDEELRELTEALEDGSLRDMADAVIDILYITAGNFQLLGDRDGGLDQHYHLSKDALKGIHATILRLYRELPLAQLWAEVHAANMKKERGTEANSKYGNSFDIVKPAGWVPPFLDDILREAGFDPSMSASLWREKYARM